MSIRTIVEINHDYIDRMHKDGHISKALYREILDSYTNPSRTEPVQGFRVMGARHHSEDRCCCHPLGLPPVFRRGSGE
jgi:hypothetical protein